MDSYLTAVAQTLAKLNQLIESEQKMLEHSDDINKRWQAVDSDDEDYEQVNCEIETFQEKFKETKSMIGTLVEVLKVHNPAELEKVKEQLQQ